MHEVGNRLAKLLDARHKADYELTVDIPPGQEVNWLQLADEILNDYLAEQQ